MATLNISQELDQLLDSAAKRAGRTHEELAEEILSANLDTEEEHLTPDRIARLKLSCEQLDRGEHVTSDQIDLFFEKWFQELKAR